VKVTILGISGSPVKDGNCDKLVQEALKTATEVEGVETEFVSLADKDVAMCTHCQYCIQNRSRCKIEDDAQEIWDMMERADGLILGGPTWFLTLAPPLTNLFSRLREAVFFSFRYRNKVGGSISCGWFGWGMDYTLDTIEGLMRACQIIPVARGAAISSTAAYGKRAAYMEHGALDDASGVATVRNVGLRVVEIARMIKHATESGIVLPKEQQVTTTGAAVKPRKKKFVEGVWREEA